MPETTQLGLPATCRTVDDLIEDAVGILFDDLAKFLVTTLEAGCRQGCRTGGQRVLIYSVQRCGGAHENLKNIFLNHGGAQSLPTYRAQKFVLRPWLWVRPCLRSCACQSVFLQLSLVSMNKSFSEYSLPLPV